MFPISPSEVSMFFLFVSALILSPQQSRSFSEVVLGGHVLQSVALEGYFNSKASWFQNAMSLSSSSYSQLKHVLNKHGTVCKKAAVVHD